MGYGWCQAAVLNVAQDSMQLDKAYVLYYDQQTQCTDFTT